jgi:hypothetical protein
LEKNLFKQGQKNLNGADRTHARDVARDAGVAHRPAPRSRWTRTLRPDLARWSMRRGPPLRTAIPALSPVATRHASTGGAAPTMSLGQPRAAVRTARRAPMLRPCRDHCGCLAHQGVVDRYKGARAVPLARLRFPAAGLLYRRAPLKATAELVAPLAFRANARPYPFPLAPLKLPRPLVAQDELQARRSTRPRGRHCCPIGAHAEIHLRPLFTADTCCSRLPLAPTEVPSPLVGHTEPPARRSNHSSGRRHRSPPYTPSGRLPAASEHPNQARSTPSSSPATPRPSSPTRSPEFHRPRHSQAPRATL